MRDRAHSLQWRRRRRWLALAAVAVAFALAAGCSTLGYYAQSVEGHFAMLNAARPLPEVIADPDTDAALRKRLARAQQMRSFASDELALPNNKSYTAYADLKRPYVVWNVFAAPELSLRLKQWCYPVVGCAGYRGYFDRSSAEAVAASLKADGLDASVSGVPAYSTLGWFSDPLLNTFINGNEGQVAGLVFHELAHQTVYVAGDTTFNESFATAVEREGVRRWLNANGTEADRRAYREFARRRAEFVALLLKTRAQLEDNYASRASDEVKRERKRELLAAMRTEYAELKVSWGGFTGYDRYFAQDLNNAHLAAVGAYNDLVPAFEVLLVESQGRMPVFYEKVRELAALPKIDRTAALQTRARSAASVTPPAPGPLRGL